MSLKKCVLYKANQIDDDDDEEGMSTCFRIRRDVKIREVPTNGEEYLMKVILERKKCSTNSAFPNYHYSHFAGNQTFKLDEIEQATAPEFLLPTKEWQNLQVADFSDVRMYISRIRAKKKLWPKDFKIIKFDEYSEPHWKDYFEHNEATLTSVLRLKPSMLGTGLQLLTETLDDIEPGHTLNHITGQWIYAVLACIQLPLMSHTADSLRTLARKCSEIRSHFKDDDESTKMKTMSLNLFICLISRYFMQYDLADPFPSKTFNMD